MSLETAKIDIAKQILSVTQKTVLDQIKTILDNTQIVAYTTDGKPVTIKAYNKLIEEAEQDITAGRVKTTEELRKALRTWKK